MSGAVEALRGVIELLEKFYESPSLAHTRALVLIDKELPVLRAALAGLQDLNAAEVPLTDDALMDEYCVTPGIHQFVTAFKAGARFAERAHGIGGKA